MRGTVFGLNLVRFCGFCIKYSLGYAGHGFRKKFGQNLSAVFGKIFGGFAVFSKIFSGFAVPVPLLYPPRCNWYLTLQIVDQNGLRLFNILQMLSKVIMYLAIFCSIFFLKFKIKGNF